MNSENIRAFTKKKKNVGAFTFSHNNDDYIQLLFIGNNDRYIYICVYIVVVNSNSTIYYIKYKLSNNHIFLCVS